MATATSQTARKKNDGGNAVSAEDIETQMNQVRSDLADLTKTVAAFGSGKMADYQSRAGQASREAVAASKESLDKLRREYDSLERELKAQIRDKPVYALGIAALFGFLLAMLMRRGNS